MIHTGRPDDLGQHILPIHLMLVRHLGHVSVDFTKIYEKNIESGIQLGKTEILFSMIDDDTIAAEKARLG